MACGDLISSHQRISDASKFEWELVELKLRFIFVRKLMAFFYSTDLESITTSNQNGAIPNGDTKHAFFSKAGSHTEIALKADSLCKTYNGHHEAVKDVTFSVKTGEVSKIPVTSVTD